MSQICDDRGWGRPSGKEALRLIVDVSPNKLVEYVLPTRVGGFRLAKTADSMAFVVIHGARW